MNNETYIQVGGQQYLRSRARSKLMRVPESTLPRAIASASKEVTEQLHWRDGCNPDLVHVKFVLDTEGGNSNWDYMPRAQLLASHATAVFKPIDMDHTIIEDSSMVGMKKDQPPVRNTICGVMTATALAWAKSGELLTDKETKDLDLTDDWHRKDEEKIAVVAWGALYQFLFPKTVASLTEAIDDGDMYVSMERWIKQYDYLVWNPQEKDFTSMTRADAVDAGVGDRITGEGEDQEIQPGRWTTHQHYNGHPAYRRSLAYVYGGVANTDSPANAASRFLAASQIVRAAASTNHNIALQSLMQVHDAIHGAFEGATTERRKQLHVEHEQVTRAIARLMAPDATLAN